MLSLHDSGALQKALTLLLRADILHDHGGFYEWTVCTGNSGFAFVLLTKDRESPNGLAKLCRSVLRVASADGYEGLCQ